MLRVSLKRLVVSAICSMLPCSTLLAQGSSDDLPLLAPDKSINTVLFAATGRLSVSADAGGSNTSTYGVGVQKPNAAARVRRAFLLAASTGFSNHRIANNEIRLNGVGINWAGSVRSGINSWNHEADVTAILKPTIDGSPSGRLQVNVTENSSLLVDGVILVVVFDDASQSSDSTVSLLFGAQNPGGDSFSVNLAQPITPGPSARFNMGLGISFGAQCPGAPGIQYSRIDVNGVRLTSSAGGQDDGSCVDGALITVGGLDDSTNNPSNPNALSGTNPRVDDELYSLLPFINASTTQVNISTLNPSNDDNIFFAYFQISGQASVTTGVCTPSATTLCLDDQVGDRRFKAEVAYSTVLGGGSAGDGQAISLSSLGVRRGGLFWFFSADNPEMLVKVLNGCPINGHYWVFYSAGTNVGFSLRVTDTQTGLVFDSSNPDRRLAPPIASTTAIPCR
jgi:hypothetical protein